MTLIEKVIELDGTMTEKPYTKEQIAEAEKSRIEAEAKAEALAIKATEKAAAQSKLAALGLTADDLKALGL